jgi:hypothetical protein
MLHYVYYPFPKGSATGANATVLKRFTDKYSSTANNRHDEKKEDHKGDVLRYKGTSLSDIASDDMLMISSHGGSKDATTICSDVGAHNSFMVEERLSANDLAKQLNDADLGKSHVLIKMLSCYAGGILTQNNNAIVRSGAQGEAGEDFFARLLAVAMKLKFNYNNVIVGGYAGPVLNATVASRRAGRKPIAEASHLYNRVAVAGGSNVDGHDHLWWFDGDGNVVPRERIRQLKDASDLSQGKMKAANAFQQSKGITSVFSRNR